MRRLAVVLLLLPLLSSVPRATVLVPIAFRQLVATAPVIVHGRVQGVRATWVDGRRALQTLVTIDASEYFKGDLGRTVTIAVPGGELGRYRTVFIGAPVFRPGDEVVLFLKPTGAAHPFVIGLNEGVFRVVGERGSAGRLVTPPVVTGASIDDGDVTPRARLPRRAMAWDRFRRVLQQLVSAEAR